MHYSTALSILASGLFLITPTFALPTEVELVPRAGVTEYPSYLTTIQESSPNTAYGNTQYTIVAQNSGGVSRVDTLLKFTNIPANSYGCQLEFYVPAGYTIKSTGNTQINIFVTTRDVQSTDTWNNAPGKSYLFGTITLSTVNAPRTFVVNSLVCKATLNFRISIASATAAGQVEANQQNPPTSLVAGWRIIHNY